jgi:hypothetical protein
VRRDARGRRTQSGQALIEAGIVVTLLMVLALGVLAFGHAILVANVIAHAARDGARMASTWPARGTCDVIQGIGPIQTQVTNEVNGIVGGSFTVEVFQIPVPSGSAPCAVPSNPQVRVRVTGCVPLAFPIIPSFMGNTTCSGGKPGFTVDRSAYFADQVIKG